MGAPKRVTALLALFCVAGDAAFIAWDHGSARAWPSSPEANVAVCDTAGTQENFRIVADGVGGVFCVWEDDREAQLQVRIKRFNAFGNSPGWPPQGIVLQRETIGFDMVTLVSSGHGTAIASWMPMTNHRLNVQKVDSTGALLWNAPAVEASQIAITEMLNSAAVLSDGSVVYAWVSDTISVQRSRIFLSRILPNGQRAWESDARLRDTLTTVNYPQVVAVSDTEVVVAWEDLRPDAPGVYVSRVGVSGVPQWPRSGLRVLPYGTWGHIAPNGRGGIAGAYVDFAADPQFGDLLLFNIGPDGAPVGGWPSNGSPCATSPGVVTGHGNLVGSPADSSILVLWEDRASPPLVRGMVQKFGFDGQPRWPGLGKSVFQTTNSVRSIRAVADGEGGLFVSTFTPSTNADLFGQHMRWDGELAWEFSGVAVSTAPGTQYRSGYAYDTSTPDSSGGAFYCWVDYRNAATSPDLYIQHVNADGTLGGVVTATEASAISATYLGGCAEVRWHASVDPGVTFAVQRQQDGDGWATIGAPADEGDDLWAARDCAVVRGARYAYRLEWTQDGSVRHSSAISLAIPLQPEFAMSPPWPNPVRDRVTFDYALSRRGPVRVSVHDLSGRLVKVIESGDRDAGEHRVTWRATGGGGGALNAGCYWLQLEAEGQRRARQVVVVK